MHIAVAVGMPRSWFLEPVDDQLRCWVPGSLAGVAFDLAALAVL